MQNCYITHFCNKTVLNLAQKFTRGNILHKHCLHAWTFFHFWLVKVHDKKISYEGRWRGVQPISEFCMTKRDGREGQFQVFGWQGGQGGLNFFQFLDDITDDNGEGRNIKMWQQDSLKIKIGDIL